MGQERLAQPVDGHAGFVQPVPIRNHRRQRGIDLVKDLRDDLVFFAQASQDWPERLLFSLQIREHDLDGMVDADHPAKPEVVGGLGHRQQSVVIAGFGVSPTPKSSS